jgi:hypothetical protein
MGKRLIISEQEKNDIRSRYGLINEQELQLDSQEIFELQTALNDYFKMKKVMVNGKLYWESKDGFIDQMSIPELENDTSDDLPF